MKEWRENRGLTQQQLADRLETSYVNVSRWENHKRPLSSDVQAGLADALDLPDPGWIWRHPDTPSVDQMLNGAPDALRAQVIDIVAALVKRAG